MAVGKDADAHALAHANVGVRVVAHGGHRRADARRLPEGVWRRALGAMRDERARAEARENGREIAGVSLFAILPLLGWACARGAGFVARGRQLLR